MTKSESAEEDSNTKRNDPRREFAEALRDARELIPAAKWSQARLAREARTSSSTISRIEGSDFPIPSDLPAVFDQIFNTDGKFKQLYEAIRSEDFAARFQRRLRIEPEVTWIAEWSQTLVPGLLQTPSYARAIFKSGLPRATDDEVRSLVRARIQRQEIFKRSVPPDFSTILCESVILRQVGDRDVMREQLAMLLAHGKRSTNVMQVLPLDGGPHALMSGPMSILRQPNGTVVVYTEGISTGGIIDDATQVQFLSRSYDVLSASALAPRASAERIQTALEAL
jgi:transcriptional regulator with XRE-family HTH domain